MALHGTFLGTATGRFARVFPQGPQLCGARSANPLYSACGGPLWIQPKQGYAATCPQGPEKEGTATWRHGLAWRSTTLCLELISGGWPDDWSQHCADGSRHIYIHVWKFTDRWQRGNSFPALLPVFLQATMLLEWKPWCSSHGCWQVCLVHGSRTPTALQWGHSDLCWARGRTMGQTWPAKWTLQ